MNFLMTYIMFLTTSFIDKFHLFAYYLMFVKDLLNKYFHKKLLNLIKTSYCLHLIFYF